MRQRSRSAQHSHPLSPPGPSIFLLEDFSEDKPLDVFEYDPRKSRELSEIYLHASPEVLTGIYQYAI